MKTATTPAFLPPVVTPGPTRLGWINLALLVVLALAVSTLLWPEWRHNPDLSHGLFMPVVSVLLLWEARRSGPWRTLSDGTGFRIGVAMLIALGLLAIVISGLYAAALEWSHPLVGFTAAGALAAFLLAGLLTFAHERVRLIPFNWSSLLACGLWVLAAPIPPGTYARLTLGLQLWVSQHVLDVLHLLGIAANREGNIIELAHGSVGIEEACSGVRSLVSCVFAGLFFSGCLVRRPKRRALIVALSAPLAIGMNFLRSLVLTLMVNARIDVRGKWHDVTGFGVLAVTAIILALLAARLDRPVKRSAVASGPSPGENAPDASPVAFAPRALCAGLLAAVVAMAFFVAEGQSRPHFREAVPDVNALLPEKAAAWTVETVQDFARFRETLQTDHFAQRTYTRATPDGPLQITLYIAYWAPGQANVSLVATHTPDGCWPGAGWETLPVPNPREQLVVNGNPLPTAEHRLFQNKGYPQHVWFWHIYDGRPIRYLDPLSPRNVLEIALRYGFRRAGDQMFVRVSSNRPWSVIDGEPLLNEFFARLRSHGL
jgi:exosortase